MRGRSLVLALALALSCATNPDPRRMSIKTAQTNSRGSWITVRTKAGLQVAGELIAVDVNYVHILAPMDGGVPRLVYTATPDIAVAELYRYTPDGGFVAWGGLGAVSAFSHGFWIVISGPIWLITMGITAAVESRHVIDRYPDDVTLPEIAQWARFPQGMPANVDEQTLLFGRQPEPPPFQPPPPPPPISPIPMPLVDAGVDAP
jgi:hypothetical protein